MNSIEEFYRGEVTNDENDARLLYTSKHLLLYSIPPYNIICHTHSTTTTTQDTKYTPDSAHTVSRVECTIYVGASTAFAATEVAGPEETFPPKNNNKTRRIDVS